jgi:hypothetical protein
MAKCLQMLLLALSLSSIVGCGGSGSSNSGGGGAQASHFGVRGPSSGAAGFAFSITVTAQDKSNAVATSYSGRVHFTSSDPGAVLPADSPLANGTATFSVTLANSGLQTITATDTMSSTIHGSFSLTAIDDEFPVAAFGAKGDGRTDDTAAIQGAINAASAAGGGSVVLSVARYFTAGTLVVPADVVLCGPFQGPFDVTGLNPGAAAIAPTLLITNTSGPFITLSGAGSGVADLLFHYPNQVHTDAAAPTVYPYTILVTAPGTKVVRSMATNAYDFLDIESGRVLARDLYIGAFHIGINIDHAKGRVTVRNVFNQVFWDVSENVPVPSPIDTWVLNNAIALEVNRVDGLELHDFALFIRGTGILLTDSPDKTQDFLAGYGEASGIDLDTVKYGIVISSSNSAGYKFASVDIGSTGDGQAAVQVKSGGSSPPKILINGGSQRGVWALGAYPAPAPDAVVVNILP